MSPPSSPVRPRYRDKAELLMLAAAFAAAHTQAPFPYSNQNQYFLHGLARAGVGHLDRDWLANTTDPTPLFSVGVRVVYGLFGETGFTTAFSALLMGYFLSAWWLVSGLSPTPPGRAARFAWAALFTAAHAAIWRLLSVRLAGVDYPWFLQAGVAGQYVLGPGLQPSAFGVLLVSGLAAFVHRRPFLAVAFQSVAVGVHSTYLLPAGLLTVGYAVSLWNDGKGRGSVGVLVAAAVGVLPTVGWTLTHFAPTTPEAFTESQRVLAFVRIPHHARVNRWLDLVAGVQLGWLAVGLAVTWRTRLFPVLAVAAAGGGVLTVVQSLSGNATFALFFPWRVSAVLVPVATAVFAWRMVGGAAEVSPPVATGGLLPTPLRLRTTTAMMFALLLAASLVGGLVVTVAGLGYPANTAEEGLLAFVARTAGPDDVYLLPSRFPAVGTGPRGIGSNSFTPPPRPRTGSNLIPVDLQRFRLLTGTPIYVDFKSVPYADLEVLEWLWRMGQCQKWYDAKPWEKSDGRVELRRAGVTHVVLPRDSRTRAEGSDVVYADEAYVVYRVE